MSTDPLKENQDLQTSQDVVTTEESSEAVKKVDQEIIDQPMDSTPDNLEASSDHSDTPHGEVGGDRSGNSNNFDSDKNKEGNQQDESSVSLQSGDHNVPTNQLGNLHPLDKKDLAMFAEYINDKILKPHSDKTAQLEKENVELWQNLTQLTDKYEQLNSELLSFSDKNVQLEKENVEFRQNLTQLTDKIDKYEQLSSDFLSVNERLAKLEESAKFKFDALIQDALKQDDGVWDEDTNACQKHIEQAKLWYSKIEALYTSVLTAISECGSRIDQCGDLMQEINKESSTLYKSLLNRYERLEISKRMLERLRDPIELLKKYTLPSEELLRLREQDLVDLLRSQNDEVEAKKILAKKVKKTGDTRYKSVREWRDLSEKLQKQCLSFIEKKLLPALDGINDGKQYAQILVIDLKKSYPDGKFQEKLDDWLKTYVDLENILVDCLKSSDIIQMSVERGQSVDYNRHEPIATEPDPDLPYESIKAVTRNGYEYKLQDQAFILRSAQVIVVKNK